MAHFRTIHPEGGPARLSKIGLEGTLMTVVNAERAFFIVIYKINYMFYDEYSFFVI